MEIFGVIAARKGSKGLPKKHLMQINGKPMIGYVIEDCLKSELLTKLVISTDDEDLLKLANSYNIEAVIRPDCLATDTSPIEDALRHAIRTLYGKHVPDITVLFQGNIPNRKEGMVDRVIEVLMEDGTLDSAVSVYCPDPHLYALKIEENGLLVPAFADRTSYYRRQDIKNKYYLIDGAVYAMRTKILMATEGLVGPHLYLGKRIKSVKQEKEYGLEVDYKEDLAILKFYMSKDL